VSLREREREIEQSGENEREENYLTKVGQHEIEAKLICPHASDEV
jgi:hypothetical protein